MIRFFLVGIVIIFVSCNNRSDLPEIFSMPAENGSFLTESSTLGESVSRENLYHFGFANLTKYEIQLNLDVYQEGKLINTMDRKFFPTEPSGNIGFQFVHYGAQDGRKIQWIMEIGGNLTSITTEDIYDTLKEYNIETIDRKKLQENKKIPLVIYYGG